MGNGYPSAPGVQGLGASGYVPTLYPGKVLNNLWPTLVLPEISNTDYEGDIKNFGDNVQILGTPIPSVEHDLADGVTLSFENLQADAQNLLIDKAEDWKFKVGKTAIKQSNVKDVVAKWTTEAGKSVKKALEERVFAYMVGEAAAANSGTASGAISGDIELGTAGGTAVAIAKTDVIERIAEMRQILNEQNVDEEGRWLIVPPWFVTKTLISEVSDAAKMGDGSSIVRGRNGRLGSLCGFTIYESNLLPTAADSGSATCTYIPFGHKMALTFAVQITSSEVVSDPYSNGTLLCKGRVVYGRKVVRPEALGVMFAKKA